MSTAPCKVVGCKESKLPGRASCRKHYNAQRCKSAKAPPPPPVVPPAAPPVSADPIWQQHCTEHKALAAEQSERIDILVKGLCLLHNENKDLKEIIRLLTTEMSSIRAEVSRVGEFVSRSKLVAPPIKAPPPR